MVWLSRQKVVFAFKDQGKQMQATSVSFFPQHFITMMNARMGEQVETRQ